MMWLRFFNAVNTWRHTPNARLVGAGVVIVIVLVVAGVVGS